MTYSPGTPDLICPSCGETYRQGTTNPAVLADFVCPCTPKPVVDMTPLFEPATRGRSVAVVLLAGLVVAALIGVWLLDVVART